MDGSQKGVCMPERALQNLEKRQLWGFWGTHQGEANGPPQWANRKLFEAVRPGFCDLVSEPEDGSKISYKERGEVLQSSPRYMYFGDRVVWPRSSKEIFGSAHLARNRNAVWYLLLDGLSRRHPAGLNIGDCCSYALSKYSGEPLLFKGNDFTKTDVVCVSCE
jgi:hypothetical protein